VHLSKLEELGTFLFTMSKVHFSPSSMHVTYSWKNTINYLRLNHPRIALQVDVINIKPICFPIGGTKYSNTNILKP